MSKSAAKNDLLVLEEGMILDYLTQEPLKDTPKERVRQEVIRALFNEYQFSLQDMESDFHIPVEGRKRKRVELAIFEPNGIHSFDTLRRVVVSLISLSGNLSRRSPLESSATC